MSLWIEALKAAGRGDFDQARNLLNEIVIALRYPRTPRTDADCSYDGPVAKAVLNAIRGFVDKEDRVLAQNNAEELIDFIVELICRKIERTIGLVEYCDANPDEGLEAVTHGFEGLRQLKRTTAQKQAFVTLRLRSMLAVGVEFCFESLAINEAAVSEVGNEKLLGFDERNLVKSLKINEKWIDFRQREKLTFRHESFDLNRHDIAAETSDFGGVSSRFAGYEPERGREFVQLTNEIAKRLNETLDEIHSRKKELGFKQIAIHRLWWEYDRDQYLGLECTEPECKTDEILASHIVETYPEIRNMNRLIAHRRRTKLAHACQECVTGVYQLHGRGK